MSDTRAFLTGVTIGLIIVIAMVIAMVFALGPASPEQDCRPARAAAPPVLFNVYVIEEIST